MNKTEANKAPVITRQGKALLDDKDVLLGWIADDWKFHPSASPLSADQLFAILSILEPSAAA